MKMLSYLCLFFIPLFLQANDGVFYAAGGTLFPIEETRIEMRKERLSLRKDGDYMVVDVYFEFYNPDEARSLTVGFVTPPAMGNVEEEKKGHPFVSDFSVVLNGETLDYEVAKMDNTDFQLSDESLANGWDFVYHFKTTFKKGINKVRHRYRYRIGESIDVSESCDYRLTTGATWAGKQIADFELRINMGENAFFSVPNSFREDGTAANWEIDGEGRIAKEPDTWAERTIRMVKIDKGELVLRSTNFQPQRDLNIGVFSPMNEVDYWGPEKHAFQELGYSLMVLSSISDQELAGFSDKELRLLRNYLFARQGYVFKSKDLQDLFSQFLWYSPNPDLENAQSKFDAEEERSLKWIQAEEARRKKDK